ncbi:MAG TPA: FecR family protein [Usitatibacter sp.]|jgi:hypothetical protein|nr:FecR family protein [Usitatibacter sp.]
MEQRSHASRWLASAASVLVIAGANAAPMQVDAVQYPAWLDRGGYSVPLTPGTQLRASDMLRTGTHARVQLRLAEGSTVKLGENARFIVEKVEDRGVFRSVMHVVYGAFRFTTGALGVGRSREIDIRVRTITAGIRGTDVWGKSTDARDLVCLLDGRVSVRADEGEAVTLDKPRDFYQRAREGAPQAGRVDEKQVREWSRETEIEGGGPAARLGGTWVVVASKFYERNKALALSRELRLRGYPAEVVAEAGVQRVEVRGLAGEDAARALMASIREVPGVAIPSISREGEARR